MAEAQAIIFATLGLGKGSPNFPRFRRRDGFCYAPSSSKVPDRDCASLLLISGPAGPVAVFLIPPIFRLRTDGAASCAVGQNRGEGISPASPHPRFLVWDRVRYE